MLLKSLDHPYPQYPLIVSPASSIRIAFCQQGPETGTSLKTDLNMNNCLSPHQSPMRQECLEPGNEDHDVASKDHSLTVPRSLVRGCLIEIQQSVVALRTEQRLLRQQLYDMQISKHSTTITPHNCAEATTSQSTMSKEDLSHLLAEIDSRLQRDISLEATFLKLFQTQPLVRSLPSEIIAEIFQKGVDLDDTSWDGHSWFANDKRGDIPFVLVASHVNRRWRDVAIGHPRLWGNLKISSTQSMDCLSLFLERSTSCLLDIRVQGGGNWEGVQQRIQPLASRWRLFSGSSFSAFDADKMVRSLGKLATPHLEDLRIHSYDQFMRIRRGSGTIPVLEGGAPKLSSLYLLDVSLKACFPPLGALKSLDLYMFRPGVPLDFDEMRDVLTTSPSLTHLKLASSVMESVNGRHDLPPIPLPSLQTLEISFDAHCCPDQIICILTALSTPKLESFVIDQAPSKNIERVIGAINILRTAADYPVLRTLMFWDVECAEYIGPAFIRIMGSVENLTLVRSAEDTILSILLEKDQDPSSPLWPKLRKLKLSVFNIDLLCRLVTNRIHAGHPIQALAVVHDSLTSSFSKEKMAWLRERLEVDEIYPVAK